jgi:hypothetical protein
LFMRKITAIISNNNSLTWLFAFWTLSIVFLATEHNVSETHFKGNNNSLSLRSPDLPIENVSRYVLSCAVSSIDCTTSCV